MKLARGTLVGGLNRVKIGTGRSMSIQGSKRSVWTVTAMGLGGAVSSTFP